jgi:hypothetical protein
LRLHQFLIALNAQLPQGYYPSIEVNERGTYLSIVVTTAPPIPMGRLVINATSDGERIVGFEPNDMAPWQSVNTVVGLINGG